MAGNLALHLSPCYTVFEMSEAIPELPFFASRAAYRAWAVSQARGRFERIEGEVIAMSPERYAHTRTKYQACKALERAIYADGVPCQAIIDGITVEVGDDTDFEPDATVNCGEPPKASDIAAPNPIIVVEVISRSNQKHRYWRKAGRILQSAVYSALPSLSIRTILRSAIISGRPTVRS